MALVPRFRTRTIRVFYCGRMNTSTHCPRFNHTVPSIDHLGALCREGRLKEAIQILLTTHNPPEDSQTYLQLLQACIAKNALSEGKLIHSYINDSRFPSGKHTFLQNQLINMYDKCGSLVDAREVFDSMREPNVFSWNMIIAAYRRHGFPREALMLFHQMQLASAQPDQFTFAGILPVCAKNGALEQGTEIHQRMLESGFLSDVVVANALIDMYAKCGSIQKARELFDKIPQRTAVSWNAIIAGYAQNGVLAEALRLFRQMPQRDAVSWTALIVGYAKNGALVEALRLFNQMPKRDVVSWNAVIAGCAQNGLAEKALEMFERMQLAGIKPNTTTFANILPACAKMRALEKGMEIHQRIRECRFLSDVVVVTALIDMYAKCGSIQKARELFEKMPQRSVVSWNAMISAYAQNGFLDEALRLFNKNPQKNVVSWNAMIVGYAQNGVLDEALRLFKEMPQQDTVSWNAIISGYAQNGALDEALRFFKEMPSQNVVSWTAMIAGYAQNGFVEKALELFNQMQLAGVKPNSSTFASILPACAKMGALEQGIEIHQRIIESRFLSDVVLVTALVDMYAKCAIIQKARKLFDKMPQRDAVSWNVMIVGYALHGYGIDALKFFELMKHSGTNPNHVSFVYVIFACSHAGLVDEGCKYFNLMSDSYSITPTMDHYICMVDLLGRASYLEEALIFIIKMPIKPDLIVWMYLLGACKSHKNIELGEFAATLLFELDSKSAAPYVLLSNIYAEVGRWGDVQKVWKLIKDRGIEKTPGCSWIEIHKTVHAFYVGDRSHPQTQEIYAKLEKLSWEMEAAGYIPDSKPILNHVAEEEKELVHHSEKLAIAFGLINTSPRTTIRVVKNLRVCVDCHTATKFISKIMAREIIVRDANRFHHFKQGKCSCGDYW